ncbi:hypothetical protein P609_15295 [Comamonas thiooxydans]|nr:hypothetical protein P609_15295 [Comamonas thiooxydans]
MLKSALLEDRILKKMASISACKRPLMDMKEKQQKNIKNTLQESWVIFQGS